MSTRKLVIDSDGPRVEVNGPYGKLPPWVGETALTSGVQFWLTESNITITRLRYLEPGE